MKIEEVKRIAERLLARWNELAVKAKLTQHKECKPDIRRAVQVNIAEGWLEEDMLGAIENFVHLLALPSGCSKWTYNRWTFALFFTRKDRSGERQWYRFHPNNFNEDDWLTELGRRKKRQQQSKLQGLSGFNKIGRY